MTSYSGLVSAIAQPSQSDGLLNIRVCKGYVIDVSDGTTNVNGVLIGSCAIPNCVPIVSDDTPTVDSSTLAIDIVCVDPGTGEPALAGCVLDGAATGPAGLAIQGNTRNLVRVSLRGFTVRVRTRTVFCREAVLTSPFEQNGASPLGSSAGIYVIPGTTSPPGLDPPPAGTLTLDVIDCGTLLGGAQSRSDSRA